MKCKDMLSVPKGSTKWKGIQTQGDAFQYPKPRSRPKTAAKILPFRQYKTDFPLEKIAHWRNKVNSLSL